MDLPEDEAHSFIVRIWLEESPGSAVGARWRGRVIHVPGGEQWHVAELHQITTGIVPYLRAMGVRVSYADALYLWLNRTQWLADRK